MGFSDPLGAQGPYIREYLAENSEETTADERG
jgi:hypothetical protein